MIIMQNIRKFKVVKNDHPADNLCRVYLAPDDGELVFEFKPGQFVMIHELDAQGNSVYKKSYSIANAPCEAKENIELGVKAQGKMSQMLFDAKVGDVFGVQGPFGVFTLNSDAKRVVFLAGGVGMSPFRSLIRESLMTKLSQEIVLFYSAPYLKDLIYHDEFMELAEKYSEFKYIPICTRECPEKFIGECKRFGDEMLIKYISDLSIGEYMMCGPESFMESVRTVLQNHGIDVATKLRFERY